MTEEEIKALQEKNKELEDKNKSLEEENKSLKAKNEEQSSSVQGLKDDFEKFKTEVKDLIVTTQKEDKAQDSKPKTLLEALKVTCKK